MNALLKCCDMGLKGYVSTHKFIDKLYSLAAETESDAILRRLAKTLSASDIRQEMQRFDNGTGRLDKLTFKKCMNKLSNATTDSEIQKLMQDLGEPGESRGSSKKAGNELMDFKKFALQVGEAAKTKALPNYVLQGPKGSSSMAKGRQGQGSGNPM